MARGISFWGTLALLAGAAVPLFGQTTFATMTGNVTDTTGAVLPDVEIVATHKTLGLTYTTRSNMAGVYTMPDLREGGYTVRASKTGFREFIADDIDLVSRQVRRVDIRLDIGSLTEKIEVVADAGVIETERATISGVRTMSELSRLPTNSDNLYHMFMTMPMTQPRGSTPSFAGSRNDQGQMSIDGAAITTGMGGNISNLAGQNQSFKEMRIEMVNNGAEHSGLGHVLLVTKSGENDLHGFGFYNYQSPAFRARDFFRTERATGIDHEYGFGVGGPLVVPKLYNGRNRTFWYISADADGASQLVQELRPSVPVEAWRRGDFSALGLQIRNPLTNEVYPDGKIPARAINPVAQRIQDWFYPLPNVGNTNVFAQRNHIDVKRGKDSQEKHGTAKLDQRFGDSDYAFVSYSLHQVDVNDWDGELPAFSWKNFKRQNKVIGMAWTHTFTPQLMNEIRFSHAFNGYPRRGILEGRDVVSQLGLRGLHRDLPEGGGVFKVNFSNVAITPIQQTDQVRPGFVNKNRTLQDDISFFQGKHNVKAGVQLAFIGYEQGAVGGDTFGNVTFNGNFTKVPGVTNSGHPYADFLLGIPNTMRRGYPNPTEDRRRNIYDFYFQDEWKVTSRLSLTLGLRYEYHAPWHESSGMTAMFDINSGKVVVADQGMSLVSKFIPKSYVDIVTASSVGLPSTTLLHSDKNNFAPRFGFAFRPFNNARTVLRGGYTVHYNSMPFAPSTAGSPFIVDEPPATQTPAPTVVFPQVFPTAASGQQSTLSLPRAYNTRINFPRTMQWSFSVDHERWNTGFTLSYVGTGTRLMEYNYNINSPVADARPYISKPRPFPAYPSIAFYDQGSSHTYNGLTGRARRRMARGLMYEASLVWARDLGDDVDSIENPFNRSREKGPDQILPNWRFVGITQYELPVGKGRPLLQNMPRFADMAVGGWELSFITYQQSGQHLTPSITVPDPTGTRHTTSATPANVTIRPDLIGNPYLENPTITAWFNTKAFAAPAPGTFGNAGRGILTGPRGNVFHAGLNKSFSFSERQGSPTLRVGLVATNIFNHPNFRNPETNVNRVGSAGTITAIGGPNNSTPGDRAGARNMYLNLRLEW